MPDFILLETGDHLLLEDGSGALLLEEGSSRNPGYFYGPLWPLPKYVVNTPTEGDALTNGLSNLETTEYYEAVAKGVIVSAPSTNTGLIYLVTRAADGTYSIDNAGTLVMILTPGSTKVFPSAEYGSTKYKLADLGFDGTVEGDVAYACAIMQ